MRNSLMKFGKFGLKVMVSLVLLVGLYLSAIVVLGSIPVNRSFAQTEKGIEILVIDNGIHTDLVLPANSRTIDWRKYLHLKDYAGADSNFTHFAFGWGNRKFYMETPEWKDLNLEVAFTAAFGIGKSAMHVYYLQTPPKPGIRSIAIKLSEAQYQKLTDYILRSFKQENGQFELIKGKGYGRTDNFYEANGHFSLLKTCNGWVNGALKAADIKTVGWAPVPHFMMRKLRKLNKP
jgi:uncharacterized protein (TIGR02117 family)